MMSKQRLNGPLKLDRTRSSSYSDDGTCTVCHEGIEFFAIGHCDHPICYKCSTRMRTLCDQMYCAICRADIPKVAFIRRLEKFDRIKLDSFCICREKFIFFEDEAVRSAYNNLLENRCKNCKDRTFPSFKELEVHMKREHDLFSCDLCLKNLTLFSCDRKFYDRKQLAEHKRLGDSNDTSYRLHPLCKFCERRYFDNDELLRHLRKDHFFCHFCEADGINNEYFEEYKYLRDHFREKHFICEEDECAQTEFTNAFRSEIDLKAHISTTHSKHLGRNQARQLRTIEVDFNYGPRPQDGGRRNNYRHRGGGAAGTGFEDRNGGRSRLGRSDQRHREEQEKRAEIDTAHAISLSLSEAQRQGSVCIMNQQLAEISRLGQSNLSSAVEKTNFNAASDDFPSLRGQKQPNTKPPVQSGDKNGRIANSNSLAQVLALNAGRSVRSGRLDEADFPSLGSQKPPGNVKNKNGIWQQTGSQASGSMSNLAVQLKDNQSTRASKSKEFETLNGAIASGKTATGFHKSVTTPDLSDFPSLGMSSNRAQISSSTWVKKKENVEPEQPPVQTERSGLLKLEIKNKGKQRRDEQSTADAKQSKLKKPNAKDKENGEGDKVLVQKNKGFAEPVKSLADIAIRLAGSGNLENEISKKELPLTVENAVEVSDIERKKQKKNKAEKKQLFTSKEGEITEKDLRKASSSQISEAFAKEKSSGNVTDKDAKSLNRENPKDKKEESQSMDVDGSDKTGTKKKGKWKNEATRKDLEQVKTDVEDSKFEPSDFPKLMSKQKAVVNDKQSKVESKVEVQLRVDATEFKMPLSRDTKVESGVSGNEESTLDDRDLATGIGAVSEQKEELVTAGGITTSDCNVKYTTDCQLLSLSESSGLIPEEPSLEIFDFQPKFVPSDFPSLSESSANAFLPAENIGVDTLFLSSNLPHLSTYPVTSQDFLTNRALVINNDSYFSALSKAPPPPGFSSATVKPPPGFSSKVTANKPPPGFTKPLISEPDGVLDDLADTAMENLHGVQPKTSFYIPPKRAQDRYARLTENIMNETTEATFDHFREISLNFRKNQISAKEYYSECSEVIGMEAFQKIFPELVVLLPNIEKQQELLATHRAHISKMSSKKTAPWSTMDNEVLCCSFCGQVILNDDSVDHWMEHSSMDSKPIL